MLACFPNRTIFLLAVVLSAVGCGRSSGPDAAPPSPIPIVWLEQGIKVEGMTVDVGRRVEKDSVAEVVEPVVCITRDDKPVADAMVFVQLVPANGEGASGEEAACVYEPAVGASPACYMTGKLKAPGKISDVAIRCRILFAGVEQEWTKTVVLPK